MILILTGAPGSCKTLYTVTELMHTRFKDREFLVNGIPDLLVPHQVISDDDVTLWHKGGVGVEQPTTLDEDGNVVKHPSLPSFDVKNKVIFIDEIQRLARPRPASQKPPDWIAALETHRHQGVDFVIITQHPQLIDVNIRRLCGQHIHMRRMWGRARAITYTWDHCGSPESPKSAQVGTWGYKKWGYKLYKSSEMHTKSGIKMPPIVWILGLVLLSLPFAGYFVSQRMLTRFGGTTVPGVPATVGQLAGAPGQTPGTPQLTGPGSAPVVPRIRDMHDPGDRPMYDDKREIVAAPRVAGCIRTVKLGCTCYTQNATPVPMPKDMCEDRLAVPKFDPYAAMWPTGRGAPSFPLSTVPDAPAQHAELSGTGYGLRDGAVIAAMNSPKAKANAPAAR
jgi:zona occludens toxin